MLIHTGQHLGIMPISCRRALLFEKASGCARHRLLARFMRTIAPGGLNHRHPLTNAAENVISNHCCRDLVETSSTH